MTSRGKSLLQATFAWPFHRHKQTLMSAGQTLVSASNIAGLSNYISSQRLSLLFTANLRTDSACKTQRMHDVIVITTQHNRTLDTLGTD